MTSATLARTLRDRIDKLEARIHNDYESLIASILQLDAHFSRVEAELARAEHGRLKAKKPALHRRPQRKHAAAGLAGPIAAKMGSAGRGCVGWSPGAVVAN
jgi:hypothetical protein